MNVGYVGAGDHIYCLTCWAGQASAGHRPIRILDDEEPGETDNFWLVDNCTDCGHAVRYKDSKDLT